MGWLKKLRHGAKRAGRYPRREYGSVEEVVEQGMLVADVAVRMTVKNAIIMNALAKHVDYDQHEIVDMVREAVQEVADERAKDAKHIGEIREEIRRNGYSSWMDADYSGGDGRTLRSREEVYQGVADQLQARVQDDDYLERTAERARKAAWHEIGDSLKVRASEPYYGGGHTEEYARERESRIQSLIDGELGELLRQHATSEATEEA